MSEICHLLQLLQRLVKHAFLNGFISFSEIVTCQTKLYKYNLNFSLHRKMTVKCEKQLGQGWSILLGTHVKLVLNLNFIAYEVILKGMNETHLNDRFLVF